MKLSSDLTWFYKFILFPLFPTVFTIVGLSLVQKETITGCILLFIGLIFGRFSIPYALKLTEVWLEGEFLVVSNYRKKVEIPFRKVIFVEEDTSINIHPIKVHLNCETELGKHIHFIPNGFQIVSESKAFEIIKEKIDSREPENETNSNHCVVE